MDTREVPRDSEDADIIRSKLKSLEIKGSFFISFFTNGEVSSPESEHVSL